MRAYVTIEVHVVEEDAHESLFAAYRWVALDDRVVSVHEHFIESREACTCHDDFCFQVVGRIVVERSQLIVAWILEKGLDLGEVRQRVPL